jgi:hypothetical protein
LLTKDARRRGRIVRQGRNKGNEQVDCIKFYHINQLRYRIVFKERNACIPIAGSSVQRSLTSYFLASCLHHRGASLTPEIDKSTRDTHPRLPLRKLRSLRKIGTSDGSHGQGKKRREIGKTFLSAR